MDLDSTIVAISSAHGYAKRAMVRISGPSAMDGIKRLGVLPKFGSVISCQLDFGENKLPVLLGAFSKNSSYTGDELIEIQFAGNPLLAKKLVSMCIAATEGREATAGEFTARAFFSGRISLAQAEGVSATISASNNAELSGAALLREGALSKITEPITSKLTRTLALVEAGIDFTDEEDVEAISNTALTNELAFTKQSLASIIDHTIPMSSLRHLPKVVLAGKPNAGKSTLFNYLIGKRRVVVNKESGTTRDAIEEEVVFGSINALLVDVAGLDVYDGDISASTQFAAQNAIDSADLVLWCVGPEDPIPATNGYTIIVKTKADLRDKKGNSVCATTGVGVEPLRKHVAYFLQHKTIAHLDAIAILPRHEELLRVALGFIEDAESNSRTPELCAACIQDSLHALGKITGRISPDDVLEHVFSSFCVGK
jgi:tRNA modification GTPase